MSSDNGQKQRKIVVVVSGELHKKAKIKAARTGRPMAVVMREALASWADEPETVTSK